MPSNDELSRIAQRVWEEKKLAQTISACGFTRYRLTDKQLAFINTALDAFKEIYLNTLNVYKTTENNQGLLNTLYESIKRNFAIKRHVQIMSGNGREASGTFSGMFAIYQAYKDDKKDNEQLNKNRVRDEMQPLINFLGEDLTRATDIFTTYVVGIAIRFQFAIESLDRHEKGLQNFAKYVACMTIQKCSSKLHHTHQQLYNNHKEKIEFMTSQLTMITADDGEWTDKTLKLVTDNDSNMLSFLIALFSDKLEISFLLAYSPIEVPNRNPLQRGLWCYTGERQNESLGLPHQLCTEQELMQYKSIYSLTKF